MTRRSHRCAGEKRKRTWGLRVVVIPDVNRYRLDRAGVTDPGDRDRAIERQSPGLKFARSDKRVGATRSFSGPGSANPAGTNFGARARLLPARIHINVPLGPRRDGLDGRGIKRALTDSLGSVVKPQLDCEDGRGARSPEAAANKKPTSGWKWAGKTNFSEIQQVPLPRTTRREMPRSAARTMPRFAPIIPRSAYIAVRTALRRIWAVMLWGRVVMMEGKG